MGMMGSGKSSVGQLLARRRGWRFIDLDQEIERDAGSCVSRIFEEKGEEGFRRSESRVLDRVLRIPGPWVLASGGGTSLREESRRAMREAAVWVIWLDAPPRVLAERAGMDPSRPLLAGRGLSERIEELARLRQERNGVYSLIADASLRTEGLSVEEVADQLDDWLEQAGSDRLGRGTEC